MPPTGKKPTSIARKDPDAIRLRAPERKRHPKRTREKNGRQNQPTAAKKICTAVTRKTTDNTTIEQNNEHEQSKQREREIKQTTAKQRQAEEHHQVQRPEQGQQGTYTQKQQVENRERIGIHIIPPSGKTDPGKNRNRNQTPTSYKRRKDKEKQEGGAPREKLADPEKIREDH